MPHTFHRVGCGPHAVIALHGWFGHAHAFSDCEPWFSRDDFSYFFMDYRGYGGMRDAAGAYTIAEIAQDVIALADTLDLASFSLIGHSMGGMAIEKVAALAPQRVRKLVALAPVPCGGVAFDAARRALFESAATSLEARKAIIDRSTGHRLPSSWIDHKANDSAAHSAPHAFAAYFHAWADTDFSRDINAAVPVNVLVGEHDPVFTTELMAQTYGQRYARVSVDVLRNAGHYPMNETPLALVHAIESFLRDEV
ncbi:alpha/beta fold hydrolase [Pandoraea anhela]|nr:alpha/beta hydrolase [Pandoraea anhela]